jgi:hypothetical protein
LSQVYAVVLDEVFQPHGTIYMAEFSSKLGLGREMGARHWLMRRSSA